MGGKSSKKHSYQAPSCSSRGNYLPPTSSGFLGRDRMAKRYSNDVKIYVYEITPQVLGKELLRRCGNEGQHEYLDATGRLTLKFLRAAISFVPDARDDGGDMRNAAFILSQPGQELLIQSGFGDWEFYFAQVADGQIYGRCVRQPLMRYMWDGFKSKVCRIGKFIGGMLSIAGHRTNSSILVAFVKN